MSVVRCIAIALACTLMTVSTAAAQVELKNDGFQAGGQVGFQTGFCVQESAAARFLAPEYGRTLRKFRFLFGSTTEMKSVELAVWDDSAGTDEPGNLLFTTTYLVTGSPNGIVEGDLTSENITVPQQFRVGITVAHMGLPGVASDGDGTIAADRNFLKADASCGAGGPYTWYRSQALGLMGDWVMRAEISSTVGGGDAGVDAPGSSTGDPCTMSAQCSAGYCDPVQMVCTVDCSSDDECGDGTCSSFGTCIPVVGEGGGCGCRAGSPDAGAGLWFLFGIGLVARRRRTG
jgi:MYXO-CTERM domain-containing protein